MHPAEWIKVLFVLCLFYTLCTSDKSISHYNKHHHSGKQTALKDHWDEENKKEAECKDLLNGYDENHLKVYWMLIEKKIDPRDRHKCFKYLTRVYNQFKSKKTWQIRNVYKRDIHSDQKGTKSKDTGQMLSQKDKDLAYQPTTADPTATFLGDHVRQANKANVPSNHDTSKPFGEQQENAAGLDSWVFIVIGIGAFIAVVIPLTLGLIYYKRRQAQRHQHVSPKPTSADASDLNKPLYDTQRSRSTDKGTERSRSTVSTYLSKDSRDAAEYHELLPLQAVASRERSSIPIFQDRETDIYEQELIHCQEYDVPTSPPRVKVINTSREHHPQLNYLYHQADRKRRNDVETPSYFNSRNSDGNRLHGGNVDVHRSSGQEEDYETSRYRPPKEFTRNESRSSSSTRSYISIPPTSPSENYIKAGLDDLYMPSEHNTVLTKMAWLTKNLKGDAKNEFSNYQSSSGTQTDSNSSITAPNCKTVFGTPWQFGGTFTSRGGAMQAEDSDVCLVVVPNAVPKGEYVDIYGAVFTDTTEIRKKLIFSTKESLITPLVEYHAVPAHPFGRKVCVQLPHALPEEFDINLIKVYSFTVDEHGTISLNNIPVSSKTNDDIYTAAYWEKGADGHSIHISTNHFSGYFCTQCESTSWPSICTMVFGSHVQITQSRREVRVILYIWDHRLTIKDYLERFRKQESDVDRQLLTDMQVPLLDNASSDSRLVMCMEVMGADDDRQSWRHILRPDGSRSLFKPLQVRKLSEIVHCCRQTDPIRVEWALENKPNQIPSAVFQCCIDVMHVHESTRDYETAMREDSDDLMRTFYVRDLKVMTNSNKDSEPREDFQRVDLKRMLSETMDITQTERVCQEFGISIKDIGNFRKKYSTKETFQLGLVEECVRRHGSDKFMNLLPKILERLQLNEVLTALGDKKILARQLADYTHPADPSAKTVEKSVPQVLDSSADVRDSTRHKSPYRRRSTSPRERHRSNSPHSNRTSIHHHPRESQRHTLQNNVSERSGDASAHNRPQYKHSVQSEEYNRSWDIKGRQSKIESRRQQDSPPADYFDDERDKFVNNENRKHNVSHYTEQNTEERQRLKHQKSSSSAGDSVLGSRSEQSRGITSANFSSRSTMGTSMFAHADPKDFAEPIPDEFLDNYLKQTYKKELLANNNVQSHYISQDYAPYVNPRNGNHISDSGPYALPPESGDAEPSSVYDPVPPYQKPVGNRRLRENSQSPDNDQTSKKELYGVFTVV